MSSMLERAVIPLSLKEPSHRILSMARCMKSFGTTQVFLVHVVPNHSPRTLTRREKQIDQVAEAVRAEELTVSVRMRTGPVLHEVVNVADSLEADYLGLAWDRQGVLKRALMGSLQDDILRLARVPVYVHKTRELLPKKRCLETVLYATQFKAMDSVVMPYLAASDFAADTLYILHVGMRAPDPRTEAGRRERALANLERLAAECEHAYDTVTPLEVVGPTNRMIVRHAHKNKVDLVVLGKADTVRPFRQIIGSTAEAIPNRVRCSVFLVPEFPLRKPGSSS